MDNMSTEIVLQGVLIFEDSGKCVISNVCLHQEQKSITEQEPKTVQLPLFPHPNDPKTMSNERISIC